MAHQVQDFEIHAGEDAVITITVTDSDGDAVDITGTTEITFAIANYSTGVRVQTENLTDSVPGVAITNAASGIFTVTLTDTETKALSG